jgi:hypothetical protein
MLVTIYTGSALPFAHGSGSGDLTFAANDDGSKPVTLKESTTIYGTAYTVININNNGEWTVDLTHPLDCCTLMFSCRPHCLQPHTLWFTSHIDFDAVHALTLR